MAGRPHKKCVPALPPPNENSFLLPSPGRWRIQTDGRNVLRAGAFFRIRAATGLLPGPVPTACTAPAGTNAARRPCQPPATLAVAPLPSVQLLPATAPHLFPRRLSRRSCNQVSAHSARQPRPAWPAMTPPPPHARRSCWPWASKSKSTSSSRLPKCPRWWEPGQGGRTATPSPANNSPAFFRLRQPEGFLTGQTICCAVRLGPAAFFFTFTICL